MKRDGHSAPSTDVAGGARSDTPLTDKFIASHAMPFALCKLPKDQDEALTFLCRTWSGFARELETDRAELLELLEELAQMAQDDAVVFGENSAWRPFYLIHAEKIRAAIARATAKG